MLYVYMYLDASGEGSDSDDENYAPCFVDSDAIANSFQIITGEQKPYSFCLSPNTESYNGAMNFSFMYIFT